MKSRRSPRDSSYVKFKKRLRDGGRGQNWGNGLGKCGISARTGNRAVLVGVRIRGIKTWKTHLGCVRSGLFL